MTAAKVSLSPYQQFPKTQRIVSNNKFLLSIIVYLIGHPKILLFVQLGSSTQPCVSLCRAGRAMLITTLLYIALWPWHAVHAPQALITRSLHCLATVDGQSHSNWESGATICSTSPKRAPKLSHYYSRTSFIIAYAITITVGKFISDGTQPTGSRLPTLGVSSLPNYGRYSQSTTGHFCNNLKKMCKTLFLFQRSKSNSFCCSPKIAIHLC